MLSMQSGSSLLTTFAGSLFFKVHSNREFVFEEVYNFELRYHG